MSTGQRLPIEGDPTAQLGVSRASMAQAVVALEVDESSCGNEMGST